MWNTRAEIGCKVYRSLFTSYKEDGKKRPLPINASHHKKPNAYVHEIGRRSRLPTQLKSQNFREKRVNAGPYIKARK